MLLVNSINNIFYHFPFVTARKLAQITSKIMSMSPVLGSITHLMTRILYKTTACIVNMRQLH